MTENWDEIVVCSRQAAMGISEQVKPMRYLIATRVAHGRFDVHKATDCLEAIRWMERASRHIARIGLHLQQARLATGK